VLGAVAQGHRSTGGSRDALSARPGHRRVELRPGPPNVGTDLNNLAALLAATNRIDDAEPLVRLMVGIFLRSSASTGHEHPFLQTAVRNCAALLAEMGRSTTQILARLNEHARPFEIGLN
jgi:hypothetical protein